VSQGFDLKKPIGRYHPTVLEFVTDELNNKGFMDANSDRYQEI
jgi:hypothetical protein